MLKDIWQIIWLWPALVLKYILKLKGCQRILRSLFSFYYQKSLKSCSRLEIGGWPPLVLKDIQKRNISRNLCNFLNAFNVSCIKSHNKLKPGYFFLSQLALVAILMSLHQDKSINPRKKRFNCGQYAMK